MTLAIGTLHREGVLVCADTLVTTGTLGYFQSKIKAYRFHDGEAVFALAGHVPNATDAIDSCVEVLKTRKNAPRRRCQIKDAVAKRLTKHYKTHAEGKEGTEYDYQLIVAIRSEVDGVGLYCTWSSVATPCDDGFQCIGAGGDVASVILKPLYRKNEAPEKAWNDAAYVIGIVKTRMTGCVGGDPIMLNLSGSDGLIHVSGYAHAEHLRTFTHAFDSDVRALLETFMDLPDDKRFEKQLEAFRQHVPGWRKQWQEKEHMHWSAAPLEAEGIIVDLC